MAKAFSIGHLPYIWTAAVPKYKGLAKPVIRVRGFQPVSDFKDLLRTRLRETQTSLIPLRVGVTLEGMAKTSMLAKVARDLKVSVEEAQGMGFTEDSLDIAKLATTLQSEELHKIDIKLRDTDPKPDLNSEKYISAVRTAIISRYCDPGIVLNPFSIENNLRDERQSDIEKALLATMFMRHEMGIKKPEEIKVSEASEWMAERSVYFVAEKQFAETDAERVKWHFIALVSKHVFQSTEKKQTDEERVINEARQREFVEAALTTLSMKAAEQYAVSKAWEWVQNNPV